MIKNDKNDKNDKYDKNLQKITRNDKKWQTWQTWQKWQKWHKWHKWHKWQRKKQTKRQRDRESGPANKYFSISGFYFLPFFFSVFFFIIHLLPKLNRLHLRSWSSLLFSEPVFRATISISRCPPYLCLLLPILNVNKVNKYIYNIYIFHYISLL